ncbi:D-beta-hydroxybutyrate dehydrogenase, mitochondrial [Amphibalanus amphitrite]|uniref:D-beta-hydroxybutyrate dehydrogenase, mitochondrial n=1 Tax=Amphibalanus amphitrite TaxID=1232801 RepID=A0A6A4VS38_AMPAM|nr:D-beta-hydroxybutyrate dehydrogenase, mitochondrial [Amphibalanus amphitrite]
MAFERLMLEGERTSSWSEKAQEDVMLKLWAVINNAGVCIPGEMQWLTWEQCHRSIQVNLEGAVRITKTFLPLLQQAKGRVVFVTSCFTDGGLPGAGLLSATSAALDALADCLRLEAQGQVKVSTVRLGDFSLTTGLLSEHHREVAAMRAALPDAAEVDRFSAYQDAVASRGLTLRSAAPPQPLPKTVCAAFEDALLTRRPLRAYQVTEGVGARLGRWLRAQLPSDLRDALVTRRFRRQLPKVTHL